MAQCYVTALCTAPPSRVTLTYGGGSINVSVCGLHARESMKWGFVVHAPFNSVRVTNRVPDGMRRYAETIKSWLSTNGWFELREAPRDWDSHGCKVYARLHSEDGISFALFHSRAYGCPLGS